MAAGNPVILNDTLVSDDGLRRIDLADREAFTAWLNEPDVVRFRYESSAGTFSARKEQRERGGDYWAAYRKKYRRVHKIYLGRSEALTADLLNGAAAELQRRIDERRRRPGVMR